VDGVDPVRALVGAPRRALAARVGAGLRAIVSGDPGGTPQWVLDLADGDDEGYFGPGSAVWAVHGDLATLVGGIRALLMQALHPAAVTGVDEHSTYRVDPLARLAGTNRWLTTTTFGSRAAADREAARVRGMHRRVRGEFTAADGVPRPYRADDERLLAWVHLAFTDSFLVTHEVFARPVPGGADAYVGQWATAAELVGYTDPPRTRAALDALLASYDGELAATEVTRRTVAFLRRPPLPAVARAGYAVLLAGAASTLRPEHRALLGLPEPGRVVPRAATRAALSGLRALLSDGPPAARSARSRLERIDPAVG
jgi:uncharacterized protein (DUF2236 family)